MMMMVVVVVVMVIMMMRMMSFAVSDITSDTRTPINRFHKGRADGNFGREHTIIGWNTLRSFTNQRIRLKFRFSVVLNINLLRLQHAHARLSRLHETSAGFSSLKLLNISNINIIKRITRNGHDYPIQLMYQLPE
ncbi:unnamed protein product, partial [Dicrocoelium dendriticum]